mgnify:CR=1 FL=1
MCTSRELVYVQVNDSATRATNTIPFVNARIAIEPVGYLSPLVTIRGVEQVHEGLTCSSRSTRVDITRANFTAKKRLSYVRCAAGTFALRARATVQRTTANTTATWRAGPRRRYRADTIVADTVSYKARTTRAANSCSRLRKSAGGVQHDESSSGAEEALSSLPSVQRSSLR